jgi:hypothetical protein
VSFRVYDRKKKRFTKDNIYLTQDGELIESKKSLFGNKMTFVDQNRYVYQKYIELNDKNEVPIYIGDYLEAKVAEDKIVRGMVTFAEELSAYIILCFDTDEYFTLGTDVCELIEVVGNVFEDAKKK